MNVLCTKYASWEIDFFRNEIFQGIVSTENFVLYDKDTDLSGFINKKNVLIINHTNEFTFDVTKKIIECTKPYAIFLLSDECGKMQNWINFCKENTSVFFHQYHHKHYNYGKQKNQIPLGYVSGFKNNNRVKTIDERTINASFVGEIKNDRHKMITTFNKNMKNVKLIVSRTFWSDLKQNAVKSDQLFDLYNNSIFVPIGRGNIKLDCFRFYEAVVAGAIPVVVGHPQEILETYHFSGRHPYMITSTTWEGACDACNTLLNEKNELQNIQDKNFAWWKNEIDIIRNQFI